MAAVDFQSDLNSGLSTCANGEYENVPLTLVDSSVSGSGLIVNGRVTRNGQLTSGKLFNVNWVGGAQSNYTTTINLDQGSSTGLSIKITATSSNGSLVLTQTTYSGKNAFGAVDGIKTSLYDPVLTPGLGENYYKNQLLSFNDGVISGNFKIVSVESAVFQITDVVSEGLDYPLGERIDFFITAQSMLDAGAAFASGPRGFVFAAIFGGVFEDTTGTVGDGAALSAYPGTESLNRMKTGLYRDLPLEGGSGSGATVDMLVATADGSPGGGGIQTLAVESNYVFGVAANPTLVLPPRAVTVSGGEGVGAKVMIGQGLVDPGSADTANPDYYPGFYIKNSGLASAGYGYKVGEEITITRQDMIDAGFLLNATHQDHSFRVESTTTATATFTLKSSGSGYEDKDGVLIGNYTLQEKGAVPINSNFQKEGYVRTLTDYGTVPVTGGTGTGTGTGSVGGTLIGWSTFASKLDAINGIVTTRTTTSRSNSSAPLSPDTNTSTRSSTEDENVTIRIRSEGYETDLPGAGPYVLNETLPANLLYTDTAFIKSVVNDYSFYLASFTKGDYYGTSITEGVRHEVLEDWTPNMPFAYWDPRNESQQAMRMDATTWTVDQNGFVFTTSGIYQGDMVGSNVVVDKNVQGDTSAAGLSIDGESGPASNVAGTVDDQELGTSPQANPRLTGLTRVNMGSYYQIVEVGIATQSSFTLEIKAPGSGGVFEPVSTETLVHKTLVIYMDGLVVTAGDTLTPNADGGIPLTFNNSILTTDATVLNSDLFAAAS